MHLSQLSVTWVLLHRHCFVAVVTHLQTLMSLGSAGAGVHKLLLMWKGQGSPGGSLGLAYLKPVLQHQS